MYVEVAEGSMESQRLAWGLEAEIQRKHDNQKGCLDCRMGMQRKEAKRGKI